MKIVVVECSISSFGVHVIIITYHYSCAMCMKCVWHVHVRIELSTTAFYSAGYRTVETTRADPFCYHRLQRNWDCHVIYININITDSTLYSLQSTQLWNMTEEERERQKRCRFNHNGHIVFYALKVFACEWCVQCYDDWSKAERGKANERMRDAKWL